MDVGGLRNSSESGGNCRCQSRDEKRRSMHSMQVSPIRGGGSRNMSPLGRVGSRNVSPSHQKVVKTKPRGLDEESVATFCKAVHSDVHMEHNIWAMLPEDLLNEILARVPPFMIFRLRSICKRWNSILQDSSFLKFHSQVPSHGPCLLTFWKNSQTPQCSVFSLPLKTWYRIPFTFLPPWAVWLIGSSGGLVCLSGLDGLTFRTLICNPLTQNWSLLPSMHFNQQRQLIMVFDRMDRSFKVIATSDIYGDKSLPTEVYDSKHGMWSLHQIIPAVNLCSSKMAFCDSTLYLETLSPLGLMLFRLDTGPFRPSSRGPCSMAIWLLALRNAYSLLGGLAFIVLFKVCVSGSWIILRAHGLRSVGCLQSNFELFSGFLQRGSSALDRTI